MRSTWKVLGVAASLVLMPQLAAADTIEQQIEKMQQRMSQLEDQLQVTNDDLKAANTRVEEQQSVLDTAGLSEGGAVSALSSFLSDTDFYGFVNTSYTQNFRNDPTVGLPFHGPNMSFAVNQVWFGMDHPSTEESRAGFHIDMLYGRDAGAIGNGNGAGGGIGNDTANSFELFTAYVSYLAPIGNGVEIQAGKLGTLIGAEVQQATGNFNITRGLVWGLQPINTTGLVVSTDLGSGISFAVGVLNDAFVPSSTDADQSKAITGQIAWSNDQFGAALSGNWGYDSGFGTDTGILDILLTADPADNLSFWFNYDWIRTSLGGLSTDTNAIALAGRVAVTDATGVSMRGEYVTTDVAASDAWSVTGTVDHHLTDNFVLRGEIRYDGADGTAFGVPSTHDDQWVFTVDATYKF